MMVILIVTGALSTQSRKDWYKDGRTWRLERAIGNYLNSSIVEIGQNTKKSPGDLRRLAVTQNPAENHQLTLVG